MTGVASSLSSSMNKQMAPAGWAVNASRGSLELALGQRDALPAAAAAVAQRVVAVGSLEDAQPRELESRRVLVS